MPSAVNALLDDSKTCDLLIYFNRPEELYDLKYTELFAKYVVELNRPTRFNEQNSRYYRIYINALNKCVYLSQRMHAIKSIIRLEMIYITAGEIWYLRLILLKSSPISYVDALTHNGIRYSSYQNAAIAKGFVTENTEVAECFEQIYRHSTGLELRCLFATWTVQGYPTLQIYENQVYRNAMMKDWLEFNRDSLTPRQALNELLREIQSRLLKDNKTMELYGLPTPPDTSTELKREIDKYDSMEQLQLFNHLNILYPNNYGQKNVQDVILNAIDNGGKKFFFIDGPGGTGKTTVINKLVAAIRSKGKLVKICASTTLAATLYDDATTAHNLFNFPVVDECDKDMEEKQMCQFTEERIELLENIHAVVWDEFISNHREIFESVILQLKHVKNLIFICAGDFRQILPVVPGGTMEDTVNACISSSSHWGDFETLKLHENMRLFSSEDRNYLNKQIDYAESILAIGEGKNHNSALILNENTSDSIMHVGLPNMEYFIANDDNYDRALNWLYPNGFVMEDMIQNCILASTNNAVDEWNERVQTFNNSRDIFQLSSNDSLADVDDPHGYLCRTLSDEILNKFNSNGVPKHILKLKINDICIVLRAMNTMNLATNTRIRILDISPAKNIIKAEVLDSSRRIVLIPRIRFKFRLKFGQSYQMLRCQFPLRLAYCMTYNKAQSQTFNKVLLDATGEPFSHGHLYVAMSRIRDFRNIRIFLNPEQLHDNPYDTIKLMPVIKNIVYPKILEIIIND